MQAVLPESLEEVGLKDLADGESVYTVPWAMYADDNGALWLNGNYHFEKSPGGTRQMKVTKGKRYSIFYKAVVRQSRHYICSYFN